MQTSVSYVASSLVFFPSSSATSAFCGYSGRRGSAGTPEEEEAVAAEWWSGDAGFGAA